MRIMGDPTTPLFSITDFISLELYQVRAFDTSATPVAAVRMPTASTTQAKIDF
jgi:hypothetical protein